MNRRTAAPAGRAQPVLSELPCACATSRQVARLLTQLYDSRLRGAGLEAPQFALLMTLDRQAPCSQVELGRRYALDKTTVSRNLKQLERKGWIESSAGADRRVRRFSLTPAGRERLTAAKPAWKRTQDQLRCAMTAAQWKTMFHVLKNLAQTVRKLQD